jgi:hypothetical protein
MQEPIFKENDDLSSECQNSFPYQRLITSPFFETWESTQTGDRSLHSTARFEPHDMLVRFCAKEYKNAPNRYSIQINESSHITLDPEYLQYINHSCHPNVFFDIHKMSLVCIRPISVDDELTFFYPSTEWSMFHAFNCNCGAPTCLGSIRGASSLSPDILSQYRLSDFIRTRFKKRDRILRIVKPPNVDFG